MSLIVLILIAAVTILIAVLALSILLSQHWWTERQRHKAEHQAWFGDQAQRAAVGADDKSYESAGGREPPSRRHCPECEGRLQCQVTSRRALGTGRQVVRPEREFPTMWCLCLDCGRMFEGHAHTATYRRLSADEYTRGLYGRAPSGDGPQRRWGGRPG